MMPNHKGKEEDFISGMHNPRAGSGPQRSFIQPSEQVKKYKKRLLNDEDFMNEYKHH